MGAWTAEDIRQVGGIAGGLTSTEIASLDLTGASTMTSLGAHNVYSSAQVKPSNSSLIPSVNIN